VNGKLHSLSYNDVGNRVVRHGIGQGVCKKQEIEARRIQLPG
jgi:hypothetical protein